jgi:hypothetical protein
MSLKSLLRARTPPGCVYADAPLLAREPLGHLAKSQPELVDPNREDERGRYDCRHQDGDAAGPRLPIRFRRGEDLHVDDRLRFRSPLERGRRGAIVHD